MCEVKLFAGFEICADAVTTESGLGDAEVCLRDDCSGMKPPEDRFSCDTTRAGRFGLVSPSSPPPGSSGLTLRIEEADDVGGVGIAADAVAGSGSPTRS